MLGCVAVAALLAGLAAPIAVAERALDLVFEAGEPAPIAVRAPLFSGALVNDHAISGGLVVARGDIPGPARAEIAAQIAARHGDDWPRAAALLAGLGLLFAGFLRLGHRGRLLRFQLMIAGLLLAILAAAKAALLLSPISALALPAAALALVAAIAVEPRSGPVVGLVSGAALALLVPIDAGLIAVLATQAVVASLVIVWRGPRPAAVIAAGVAGGLAAAAAVAACTYAATGAAGFAPVDVARSPLVAAAVGGALSGPLALALAPLIARLCGEVSTRRLLALQDFSNPLLQDLAGRAPGTWQHSLAVASMAESAVAAIGGNAALVRTGAYYHDLGKSLQPKYFAENLAPGEPSPHESLETPLSAAVISAHVTEGVRIARRAKLPERVIDFVHMHHGQQLLEPQWTRYRQGGGPLGADDFRYPGVIPQTRETGVLAICDAVEVAARDLAHQWAPDRRAFGPSINLAGTGEAAIAALVKRVVYDLLDSGQLDDSGLDSADLRTIAEVLCQAIHVDRPRASPASPRDAETVAIRKPAPAKPPPPPRPARHTQVGVEAPDRNDIEVTAPLAPAPAPRRRDPRTEQLSAWQEALEKVSDSAAPAAIELLESAADDAVLEPTSLAPGTLVIGPPPETHPGDHTVERRLPIPREGIRPSKRRTEQREVVVPPEAFPDDTAPATAAVHPGADDD